MNVFVSETELYNKSNIILTQQQHTHENKRRGLMFVISAPSGTGKTTLAKLLHQNDEHIYTSISMTTRSKRKLEVDSVDYNFVSKEEFETKVKNNEFLEYAQIFGNYYGTPKDVVESHLSNGQDVLFDIDWQGHRQLIYTARADLVSVFILPPSKIEMLRRLKMRNQDNDAVMKTRINAVNSEINHWYEYDYVIINRNIEDSLNKLLSILKAERLKKNRRIGLAAFVTNLLQQELELTDI